MKRPVKNTRDSAPVDSDADLYTEQDEEQTTPPVTAAEEDEDEQGEFDGDRPPLIDGRPTLNGKPIPAEFEHAIPTANTDQGRWDANHAKPKRTGPKVEVVSGEWENSLRQRRDQPWMGSDPFKEAVDAHREKGFTYRMLSPKVVSKRGLRGWEPVKT